MNRYTTEILPNGYIRIYDRRSQWAGLYTTDGKYQNGNLRLSWADAIKIIMGVVR